MVSICTIQGVVHAAAVPQASAVPGNVNPSFAYNIISVANAAYVDVTTDSPDFDNFNLTASPSNLETPWYLYGTKTAGVYTVVYCSMDFGVTVDNSTQAPNPLRLASRDNDRPLLPLQIVPAGGGAYKVKVANKNLLWTLYSAENKIRLLPPNGKKTQLWKFVETDNT
ncbi:hypothetical protein EXIGLDRAFT_761670 [Exidia glandulosa HHB12029]|uniref:Ricin B lectin domain-containing protein n=1 Tax=Exidia glandulosa HHB12029 TaxID=1314781 RepID=A0A165NDK9_EXIGL|nr:hypothetical protein EXIGLDRAFT_761670 [Exidia glandulosa HHB12029]